MFDMYHLSNDLGSVSMCHVVLSAAWRTGVDGASDDSAERVPRAIIEPVVKLVKALLGQETSGPVVKISEFRRKGRHDLSCFVIIPYKLHLFHIRV